MKSEHLQIMLMTVAPQLSQSAHHFMWSDDESDDSHRGHSERLVYVPMTGPHVGALAEAITDSGRCITIYDLSTGQWELAASVNEYSPWKESVWIYNSLEFVTEAMRTWDGFGEPRGAAFCKKAEK